MAIDSSIYSMVQPQQQIDPLAQYGKLATIQNLTQQNEMHGLQVQQLKKTMATDAVISDAVKNGQDIGAALKGAGAYKELTAWEKAQFEKKELEAKLQKTTLESHGLAVKAISDEIAKMAPGQSTEALHPLVGKFFSPEEGAKMLASLPSVASPEWIAKQTQSAQALQTNLQKQLDRDTTQRGQNMTQGTAVRGQDMTAATAKAGQGVTMRGQNMVDARQRDANGVAADGVLTPEAEAMANGIAEGRLAPLSGFALNKPGGRAVMGRVLQINPNYRGGDFAVEVAGEKGFLAKNGPQIRGFNVVINHLDTAQGLYDALKNGDVQAINSAKNAFQKQFGSAAPTSLDAAKQFIAAEAVRAVSGAAGALGDRQTMEKNLATNLSDDQFLGTVKTIKELAIGQMEGHKKQYESVVGPDRAKDFTGKFLTDKAKALYEKKYAPAGAAAPATAAAPTQADIDAELRRRKIIP